jgi:hypothetical protein
MTALLWWTSLGLEQGLNRNLERFGLFALSLFMELSFEQRMPEEA